MRILVTGAHGLLGRSILRQSTDGVELVACGRRQQAPAEADSYCRIDLLDGDGLKALLDEQRPDWVIHTAALTNVDLCETDREQARRINLDLVGSLAELCAAAGAGLAHLSTDYVFDGTSGPYGEEDGTHPLSYYGLSKLESEALVLESEHGLKGLVLRALWLYGYVPETRRNLVTWPVDALARGQEMAIVDDQWGNPTLVDDVAQALLQLCIGERTGLYHIGGADYMTRYELVRELGQFFGLDTGTVRGVSTAQAGQTAPRPLRSGLKSDRVIAESGVRPAGFAEGLRRMSAGPEFQRDFADLLN